MTLKEGHKFYTPGPNGRLAHVIAEVYEWNKDPSVLEGEILVVYKQWNARVGYKYFVQQKWMIEDDLKRGIKDRKKRK